MSAPAPSSPPEAAPSEAAPAAAPASAWARLLGVPWVASTYFAEGLPFSIVRQLSSEFLTSLGADPKKIGATSLYGLAWNLKLLWSPLLDRYGTLRGWLVAVQALLGLVVMGVAWPAGRGDIDGVAGVLVVAAFLAATHDVAIDGFYIEALDKRAQAELSGLRIIAYKWALGAGKMLLVLAGALQLAGWARTAAWRATFFAAGAALVLLAGLHAAVLPRSPPRRASEEAPLRYTDAFRSFLAQPRIAASLAFIVLYKVGDALMFAQNGPFLRGLGLEDLRRGAVGTAGLVAGMGGALVGGPAIGRYGLRRTLRPIAVLQSVALVLYVALAVHRPGVAAVSAVAVVEQLAGGVGDSALAVFLLRRCSKEHKAAHFAIGSALMSVGSTVAGVASGYLVGRLGYPAFFTLALIASLPGVVLAWLVPQEG